MPVHRGMFVTVFMFLMALTFTHSFRPCRSTIVHRNLVQPLTHSMNTQSMKLYGAIIDLVGEDETPGEAIKVETHGYEGDFKVGDVVRVKADIRIWSVKEYSKEGFDCKGYEGTIKELVLYGRKLKVGHVHAFSDPIVYISCMRNSPF